MAGKLADIIDGVAHATYVEVFMGMGGVFFRRRWQPKAEVVNDLSRDVATFFRILNRHYPQFMDTLRFQITSRADFERLLAVNPDTLTDLERSARFLYLQRATFGGKVRRRTFGVSVAEGARFNLTALEPLLRDVHERLTGVVIECLPWAEMITRYDRPGTLFYLDPPYWGCERDYGDGVFARDDFAALTAALAAIQGKFVLSLNDLPEVRALFAGFVIRPVTVTYSVGGGGNSRPAGELIITNFDWSEGEIERGQRDTDQSRT